MSKDNRKFIHIATITSLTLLFMGVLIALFRNSNDEIFYYILLSSIIFILLFILLKKRQKPINDLISINKTFVESSLLHKNSASFTISDDGSIVQIIYNNLEYLKLSAYKNIIEIADNYIDRQEISYFINKIIEKSPDPIVIYKSIGVFKIEGLLSKNKTNNKKLITILLKDVTALDNSNVENKILVEKNKNLEKDIANKNSINSDFEYILNEYQNPVVVFQISSVGYIDRVLYINSKAKQEFKYIDNNDIDSLNYYSDYEITKKLLAHNFYEESFFEQVISTKSGMKFVFEAKHNFTTSSVILSVEHSGSRNRDNFNLLDIYVSNFKHSPDGVIIFNTLGTSAYINDSMIDLLRLDIKNHTSLSALELTTKVGDIDSSDYIASILNQNKSVVSKRYKFKNSNEAFVSTFHPLFNNAGEIDYVLRLTYRLKEETVESIQKEANMSLENILRTNVLTNFSHEIRTSMNSILGTADILDSYSNNLEEKEYINLIKRSGEDVHSLLESFRLFTQLNNKSLLPFIKQFSIGDLMELIKTETQYITERFSKQDIQINYLILPEILNFKIQNDFENVKNIIIQLIENSLKYTDDGYINIGFNTFNERQLTVWVEDSGAGISDSILPTIFIPFSSVNPTNNHVAGLGIGLSIAKELTELLGGNIEVESVVEKGSKFTVNLPIGYTNKHIQAVNKTGVKILIAQYGYNSNEDLKKYLKSKKITVFTTNKGGDAIEILSNNKDINIVFTDVTHSDLTGIELIKALRRISPNVIVIAQAPYFILEEKIKLLNNGFNDYLVKPIFNNQFIKTIEKFLP